MRLKKKIVASVVLTLFMLAPVLNAGSSGGAAFRTIHQFNLTTIREETRLLVVLDEFNQLFSKLGFPDVKYRLWRIQEGGLGQLTYLYDSIWPDRAAYDKVHQDSAYKTLLEKHLPFVQQVLKDEVYCKYVELGTGGRKK